MPSRKATNKPGRALLAGLLLCAVGPAAGAAEIEYLYVNASEGTASGGHAALKIGEEVFHFQHVPPGLLRLQRDDFAWFREEYGGRENRTIRSHRIEVSDATRELLRERFNRILLIEDEQFDRRDALEKDRRLLETLLRQAGDPGRAERLELKGLGLFLADGWQYSAAPAAKVVDGSVARLARRIAEAFGDGFLEGKSREVFQSLKALRPEGYDTPPALAEDYFLPAGYGFADRYADHLSALAAVQVLTQGLPLREGVLLKPEGAEFRLGDKERQGLVAYRTRLEGQLLALLRSPRPDWGLPLLVGMARLVALDASIDSGYWAFLNLAEASADADAVADGESYGWRRSRFIAAKAALASANPVDEWAYARVEQAANLFFASGSALRTGGRASALRLTPARPAQAVPIPLGLGRAQLQSQLQHLQAYGQAYADSLAGLYAYDLLSRNCASEIFRVIDAAMREDGGWAASLRNLGGQVSGWGWTIIPFVSFQAVGENWRVAATEEWPSYRRRRLEQAKLAENPLLVDLRESNVFTSSLYHWHGGDAAFVFFTDEAVWARPLAGGANLAAGLAQGLVGLFTWPWDLGGNLRQGVKGALVSLPELLFFNIRKGSFPGLRSPEEPEGRRRRTGIGRQTPMPFS